MSEKSVGKPSGIRLEGLTEVKKLRFIRSFLMMGENGVVSINVCWYAEIFLRNWYAFMDNPA